MRLFKIRLLCGTHGLYEAVVELPRLPISWQSVRRTLIDTFGPNLQDDSLGDVAISWDPEKNFCTIDTLIGEVPAVALIIPVQP